MSPCGATTAPAAKLVRFPYGQPSHGPHSPCIASLAGIMSIQKNSPISASVTSAFRLYQHNFFGPGRISMFCVHLSSSIVASSTSALRQYRHPSLVPRSVFFVYIGIFFIPPNNNRCHELILTC